MPESTPTNASGLPADVPLEQHKAVEEEQCIALYGAMLAIAASDGSLDPDGVELLYRLFDLSVLSDKGRQQVHAFLRAPPKVRELLAPLRTMDDQARFGSMLQLIEIACAEDIISERKRALLQDAQAALGLHDDQVYSLESFVATLRTLRHRGVDSKVAANAIRRATVRLRTAGIPVELPTTTSRLRRHAVGFACGLMIAVLFLSLGAGRSMACGLGALSYVLAAVMFGRDRSPSKQPLPTERKLKVFPPNIQESITLLEERIVDMSRQDDGAADKYDSHTRLTQHREAMQQLLLQPSPKQSVTRHGQPAASVRGNLDAPAGPYLSYLDIRKTLQDADVLMFRGTHPISRMLQAGAQSSYSHCGLVAWWHRRAMLLQADSACIQAVPLSIALQSYPGEVDWYQIRPEYRQMINVSSIIEEAQVNLGLAYGKTALLRTILHDVVGLKLPADCEHPEALFCSQYVARCFRRAGLPLQPQSDIATFPSEIALSPILRFIGTIVPNMSAAEARALLDRSRAP